MIVMGRPSYHLNTHTALYSLSLPSRMKEKGQRTGVTKQRDQNKDRQLTNQVLPCENQTGFEELNV